jgi:hypothetical protein
MHVEFLGIPRQRVGVEEMEVDAATLGELLTAVARRFPALGDLVADGHLHPSLTASLNGDAFVSDPSTELSPTDRNLLLSADVGG